MLESFVISVLAAVGIAIVIVQKGDEWPLEKIVLPIRHFLKLFHSKLPEMLDCSVCTSFWASLATDLFLFAITGGCFLWPLTGFAASGISWVIYELLNVLDSNE